MKACRMHVLTYKSHDIHSSGYNSRVGGTEKYEIYAAALGGHLFYDLFLEGIHGIQTGQVCWSLSIPFILLIIAYYLDCTQFLVWFNQ